LSIFGCGIPIDAGHYVPRTRPTNNRLLPGLPLLLSIRAIIFCVGMTLRFSSHDYWLGVINLVVILDIFYEHVANLVSLEVQVSHTKFSKLHVGIMVCKADVPPLANLKEKKKVRPTN
jgi:hypothetical protein